VETGDFSLCGSTSVISLQASSQLRSLFSAEKCEAYKDDKTFNSVARESPVEERTPFRRL
jgi:hypothetical protein